MFVGNLKKNATLNKFTQTQKKMPKNKGKGGKNRRRGKNLNEGDLGGKDEQELTLKEDAQEYAQVLKMLGNGRLEAHCFDGQKRLCHIRGKMRKKVWVAVGDIVLVGLREFQNGKGDVIQKYSNDEARRLKASGELPQSVSIASGVLSESTGEGCSKSSVDCDDSCFDFDEI